MSDPPGAPEESPPEESPVEGRFTDPREPPRATRTEALLIAAGVTVGTAAGTAWAFSPSRAGAVDTLSSLAAVYIPGVVLTVLWLRRRGELRAMLRPMGGDLALGFLIAALLYGAAMGATLLLMSHGSPREAWILRFYLHLGGPEEIGRVAVGGAVFVIAALEEVVWRGLAMRALTGPFGAVGAWLLTTVLYAVAHLPTLVLLGGPEAGPNPLLPAAAFGCGLVWGRIFLLKGRLMPAVFAHAFFSWAVASFPIWRP